MFSLDPIALRIIERTALFAALTEGQRQGLMLSVRQQEFEPGSVLIQEGEVGKTIFIMIDGTVEVKTSAGGGTLAEIPTGSFFGELSAVLGEKAIASVVAADKVQVAAINVDALRNDPTIWSAFLLIVVKDLAFKLRDANAKNSGK